MQLKALTLLKLMHYLKSRQYSKRSQAASPEY